VSKWTPGFAGLALAALATACLPSAPATGRPGPVHKVEIIGDSITWGLFGTTPSVEASVRARLAAEGISVTFDGGAGDTLQTPWPGHADWASALQARIDRDNPDVVIIQSMLFPGAGDPASDDAYLHAASHLLDIAQSRGAHVYLVAHHRPTNATELHNAIFAQMLQGQAASGRGVPTVPLDWWLAHCRAPFASDGWHLSADGERCWATAATAAINQLREAVG
jgi:lysophospholipase L1-like esterase